MAPPNLQPTLIGPRITVRPVASEDWESLAAAASDPEIWAGHPERDRYKPDVFRRFFDSAVACQSAFAFVDNATGRIVGSSRYNAHDPTLSEIEIGWTFLMRPYWGGSYNAEVKGLMLGHAFTFVDTVVFWVGETNRRSQRAMEKIGGVRRKGLFTRTVRGVEDRAVVFEIRKEHREERP